MALWQKVLGTLVLVCTLAFASPSVAATGIDLPAVDPTAEIPVDHTLRWRRLDRGAQIGAWVGVGLNAAGSVALGLAFTTRLPGWIAIGVPLAVVGMPLAVVGSVGSAYVLYGTHDGPHPFLGLAAAGLGGWAILTGMVGGLSYIYVDLFAEGPVVMSGGTKALLGSSLGLWAGASGLALAQLAINSGTRRGEKELRFVLAPRVDPKAPGVQIAAVF